MGDGASDGLSDSDRKVEIHAAAKIRSENEKVLRALAKRGAGLPLTDQEEIRLEGLSRGLTPAALVAVYGRIAATAKRDSTKVMAATAYARLAGYDGAGGSPPTVNVGVAVGVKVDGKSVEARAVVARLAEEDPEALERLARAREAARAGDGKAAS